jgi:GH24 family phage-related lysozyme (muramidase)
MLNKDTLDVIMDSIIVKRPIDSHVFAVKTLIEDEGFSATQYPDGKGNSVGYGFFVNSLEPDERAMIGDINNITKPEADAVLNVKVKKIHDKFMREVPGFETFSATRQAGFISFAYQLGYENVTAKGPDPNKNWPKFFNAMKRAAQEPWNSDSRQMVLNEVRKNMFYNFSSDGKSRSNTFWYNQTPRRAVKVGEMIRGY